MLARCMAECGVAFRVELPKSSRFSSRASRQNTGVLYGLISRGFSKADEVFGGN
jgi:hypothetical protein